MGIHAGRGGNDGRRTMEASARPCRRTLGGEATSGVG
jgi:hypothetical protein